MNILFTSSGRRVELLVSAKKTLERFGGGKIVAADASSSAPTSKFCDIFELVPRISDGGFVDALLEICARDKIDILIPTIDTELSAVAERIGDFEKSGVLVNISEKRVVDICGNKFETQKFFESNGILAPELVPPEKSADDVQYPLFIKPADGSSSINAFAVQNAEQLRFFRKYVPNPIVQKMVFGDEYTVDVFCDFDSNPITVVPRRRLATRAGEILKGRVVRDVEIIDASIALVRKLKPFGHITLQCIKSCNGIYFIEINPRFGGGAPMSIAAGADSIENLLRLKSGGKLSYNENWTSDMEFSRFDSSVVV